MAGFSDYLEAKVLNWLAGTSMGASPTIYVGLFSAAPNDAGGGTEVTTTIRVAGRVAAAFGAASGTSPTQIANSADVDFGVAAGGATVTHFALFDAASAGNMLGWAAVTTTLTFSAGINVSFITGALTVSLD